MYHRTTIVLPPRIKQLASARASKQGISFSEFVRRAIETAITESRASRKNRQDPLFSDSAVFRGDVPRDTAARHDAYLYGDDD